MWRVFGTVSLLLISGVLQLGAAAHAQPRPDLYEVIVDDVHGLVTARINGVVSNVVPGMRLPHNALVTTTPGSSLKVRTPNKYEGNPMCRLAMAGQQTWLTDQQPGCCAVRASRNDVVPSEVKDRALVVDRVDGAALVVDPNGRTRIAKPGMKLHWGDRVMTAAGSSLTLFGPQGCRIPLAQSQSLLLDQGKTCCDLEAMTQSVDAGAFEKSLASVVPQVGVVAADQLLFGAVNGWAAYKSLSGK